MLRAACSLACFVLSCVPLACSDRDVIDFGACEATQQMHEEASRRMPGACRTAYDDGIDGVVDAEIRREFDDLDRPTRVEFWRGGEGVTWFKQWAYDPDGLRAVQESIDGSSGDAFYRAELRYEAGNLVRKTEVDVLTGEPTRISVYTYGSDGQLTRIDLDREAANQWEHRYLYQYEAGVLVHSTAEYYWQDGWHPIWERHYAYDDKGFLIEERYDHHSGTEIHDSVTVFENDRFGNELAAEHTDLVDGERTCSLSHYACD